MNSIFIVVIFIVINVNVNNRDYDNVNNHGSHFTNASDGRKD